MSEAFKSARFIQQLLGHFELEPTRLIRAADYQSGEAAAADFIFAVFEEDRREMTTAVLQDLAAFSGPIVCSCHVGSLLAAAPEKYGFLHAGFSESRAWKVLYQGVDFAKDDPWINVIRVPVKGRAGPG